MKRAQCSPGACSRSWIRAAASSNLSIKCRCHGVQAGDTLAACARCTCACLVLPLRPVLELEPQRLPVAPFWCPNPARKAPKRSVAVLSTLLSQRQEEVWCGAGSAKEVSWCRPHQTPTLFRPSTPRAKLSRTAPLGESSLRVQLSPTWTPADDNERSVYFSKWMQAPTVAILARALFFFSVIQAAYNAFLLHCHNLQAR